MFKPTPPLWARTRVKGHEDPACRVTWHLVTGCHDWDVYSLGSQEWHWGDNICQRCLRIAGGPGAAALEALLNPAEPEKV